MLRLVVLLISLSLVACGTEPGTDFAERLSRAARQAAAPSPDRPPAGPLRPLAMAAAAAADAGPITPDQLFDWAEAAFPQLFPAPQRTQRLSVYRFRYYPQTDLYLAVENALSVIALGGPTGGQRVDLGRLEQFAVAVNAWNSTSPFFREVQGAFPEPTHMATTTRDDALALGLRVSRHGVGLWYQAAVDLDGDGRKELLVGASTITADPFTLEAGYSRLFVYGMTPDGRFEDRTSHFIEGSAVIRSTFGAGTVVDLNGDGRPDIVFATHQEDGRNEDRGSLMDAFPMALLSQPSGRHRFVAFGTAAWNLNLPIVLKGPSNENLVVMNNGGWRTYRHSGGRLVETEVLGGQGFQQLGGIFMKHFRTPDGNQYIVVPGIYPDVYSLRIFQLQPDLSLRQIDTATSGFSVVGSAEFTTWQGSVYPVNIVERAGEYFVAGAGYGLGEACVMTRGSGNDVSLLVWGSAPRIVDYTPGAPPVQVEVRNLAFEFTFSQGKLTSKPAVIEGWDSSTNRWSTYCEDLNGDGHDDIWVASLNDGLSGFSPLIFINQRDGTFRRVSADILPTFSVPYEQDNLAFFVADFDGDGLVDVVSIPSVGDGLMERATMKFFRGQRRLP